MLDRVVTVRFDANVTPGMAWDFEPEQRTMRVKVGENVLAFYKATNTSDQAHHGRGELQRVARHRRAATSPRSNASASRSRRSRPGETVEMPVSFFVDPKIAEDRDADGVHEITLSYTFYPVSKPSSAGAAVAKSREAGQGS